MLLGIKHRAETLANAAPARVSTIDPKVDR